VRNEERVLSVCLIGVALSLLLVGVVSGTLLRHMVQIIPVLIALAVAVCGVPWARDAARSVFVLWFLLMLGIWVTLLGIAKVFSGRFTTVEIALTIGIGVFCVAGLLSSFWTSSRVGLAMRAVVFIAFGALQFVAVWLSLRPGLARR
jgi:hypothetical protein